MIKLLILLFLLPGSAHAASELRIYSAVTQGLTVPTSGTGQSVLAIFNPSTSTHRAHISGVLIYHETGSAADGIRWSIRRNAVFSSSGTLIARRKLNFGAGKKSQMEAGINPVVADGDTGKAVILAVSYRDAPVVLKIDPAIIVRPGESFYLRGGALSSAADVSVTILWSETKQ